MDITVEKKQVSTEERAQIDRQVRAELVEHLYQGCLPGTIGGVPVGIAMFLNFYGYTPNALLIPWYIYYNLALLLLTGLFFFHRSQQQKYDDRSWLAAYSVVMCICASAWGFCSILIPDQFTRQYIALFALLIFSSGYTTGSIGVFRLCVVTLSIILMPLIAWAFLKHTFFFNLVGIFTSVYFLFMLGINKRSTEWFKDSLKLKLENTLVSYQATHDLMTDLPNQRLLQQYLQEALKQAGISKESFALVSFSLNRMEIINDSIGHSAGDAIVQSVAIRLNQLAEQNQSLGDPTRMIVTISRKDTFTIIFIPIDPFVAEEKIRQLFHVLNEPFYLEPKGIRMTASIGATIFPKDGDDMTTLLKNADAAMLQAKQFGGDRLEFYREEINAHMPKRLEIENDLHEALKKNEFILYYQPLVDIKANKIAGMEALIRWPHPTRGMVSPVNFIPIAEETGLIIPIGEWVLHEACSQARLWHKMGYTNLRLAVNLAEKQLRDKTIIDTVQRILIMSGFDPKHLELEITETAILDENVINTIKQFKEMGLSLAVDDFGTGYSGLSYLKRFSIDKVKIDQSFIRDIPQSNDSITIVSAILAMSKELKLRTLAEGVETIEQLEFLKQKSCDYVQGYYFSKPVDPKAFLQLLEKEKQAEIA
jgi:diguanylate cyclase (GGDEF)-like protein